MNVLVTGGAGYVGSHTAKFLKQNGILPVTLDNLSRGHKWAAKFGPFYKGDIANKKLVQKIIKKHSIEAVLHFAAYAYVGESVNKPEMYYTNNVLGTIELLQALLETNVRKFVFSSTCATYGVPEKIPITETTEQNPINPYGRTKLIMEHVLSDFGDAYKFKSIALRYFNAAGADPELEIGEDHNPETHLIPLTIEAAINNKKTLTIMGDDYPTDDGTCVRDYIHVTDLAQAHYLALKNISKSKSTFAAYNLGTNVGSSVKEILKTVEEISGKKIKYKVGPRRVGDPPILVAAANKAREELGWTPKYNLHQIIETAYKWYNKHHL